MYYLSSLLELKGRTIRRVVVDADTSACMLVTTDGGVALIDGFLDNPAVTILTLLEAGVIAYSEYQLARANQPLPSSGQNAVERALAKLKHKIDFSKTGSRGKYA